MSPQDIANQYIATWNERDDGRRRRLVEETWTPDGAYVDPIMAGSGADAISAMIGAAQRQFPEHYFALVSDVDAYGDRLRFSWMLAPIHATPVALGTDFAELAADGRLKSVAGFFDATPAP